MDLSLAPPESGPKIVAEFIIAFLLAALIITVGIVFAPLGRDRLARWTKDR